MFDKLVFLQVVFVLKVCICFDESFFEVERNWHMAVDKITTEVFWKQLFRKICF